jgi:hypothetical protein
VGGRCLLVDYYYYLLLANVAACSPTLGAGASPAGLGKKGPELELVVVLCFFFVVGGAGVLVLVGGVGENGN